MEYKKYRNEYNETETDTDTVVTSGKRERRKGKLGVGIKRHKLLCIKGTLNSTGNTASILKNFKCSINY